MKLKKWLSVLLAAVLVFGLLPAAARAEGGTKTIGDYTFQTDEDGNCLIQNADDWNGLAAAVEAGNRCEDETFIMTADIGSADAPITRPIGRQTGSNKNTRKRFSGTFDGGGHTLTVELTSSSDYFSNNKGYVAPFAYTAGATIKNLHVAGNITTTAQWASGLVGSTGPGEGEPSASKTCVIDNCHVDVTLTNKYTTSGSSYPNHGGFVGIAEGATTISNSWFDGTVTGHDYQYSGGFIGMNKSAATVTNCLFAATISDGLIVTGSAEFVRDQNNGSHTLENVYYLTHFGEEPQGVRVHTSYGPDDIYDTVTFGGTDYYVINGSKAWENLQAAIAAGGTIALEKDYEAGLDDSALVVPAGITVTLDMKGHTLDRDLIDEIETGAPPEDGCVIKVESGGTLNIIDSVGGGVITGGFNSQGSGIHNEGTANISNVTIMDNGTMDRGGGIYNAPGSTLSISDVTITGNLAENSGAKGLGVYVSAGSTTAVSGYIKIQDNDYVDVHGTTHTQKNLYLESGCVLTISGALDSSSRIGVTLQSGAGVFTEGLSGKGSRSNFTNNGSTNLPLKQTASGEAALGYIVTVSSSDHGTVTADKEAAAEGDTVTLAVTPDDGYAIDTVSYNDGSEHTITPAEGVYSFAMPTSDVTVSATFTLADGYHAVTVDPATRGTIAVSDTVACAGTRVYLSYPESSYSVDLNELSITDASGETIQLQIDDSWNQYFVMPDSDVTITAPVYNIYVNQPSGGTLTADKTIADPGETVTVTVSPLTGRVLSRLYYVVRDKNDNTVEYDITLTEGDYTYTFTMPSFENAFPPVSVYATLDYVPQTATVSYIDENGDTQSVTATLLLGLEPSTYNYSADIHLGTADQETWYAVQENVFYDKNNYQQFNPNLIADGTVNLILCDGKALTGVGDLAGGTFKIYGQSNGTGAATVYKLRNTNLYLYGGSVTAAKTENLGAVTVGGGSLTCSPLPDDSQMTGLLDCSDLTVTNGTVDVSRIVAESVSISGGTVTSVSESETGILCFEGLTITGGTVTATGSENGVRVNEGASISGGTVTITGGDLAINCMESQYNPNPDNNVSITGGNVVINGTVLVYSTLTLGWTNGTDSITINGNLTYDGTTQHDTGIVFANTLFDGTHQLTPTTIADFSELRGKTLVPYIPTRNITVDYTYAAHGFASAQEKAMPNEEVPLSLEPALGSGLKSLTVVDAGNASIAFNQQGDPNIYFFIMPDSDVTVTPVFSYMITVEANDDTLGEVTVLVNDVETLFADPQNDIKVIIQPAKGVQITQFQLTRNTTTGNGQPINYSMEGSYGGPYTYTFTMPYDGAKVSVSYEPTRYTIDLDVSGNGTASITTAPTGNDSTYHYGDRIYLSVTPAAGYVVGSSRYSYNDDGAQHSSQLQSTDDPTVLYFDMPASPVTVYISFAKASNITLNPVGPGTVTSDHMENVAAGTWVMVTATPNSSSVSGISYKLKTVSITGASGNAVEINSTQTVGNDTRYYFYMPAEDVTVNAEFSSFGRVLLASAEHGTLAFVSGNGWDIQEGSTYAVRVTPDAGYKVSRVYYLNVDDSSEAAVEIADQDENGNYVFTMPVLRLKVYAEFVEKDYTVTVADGIENGSVSADVTRADAGDTVTLTVTPADGYVADTVSYNDGSEHTITPAEGVYSFTMPAANVTVSATFKETKPSFKSKSLVLSGQIGVNFYMDLSCLTDEEKEASYMEFTVSGAVQRVNFDADKRDNNTGNYYGFTCYVSSVQMADNIAAVFHYGENGSDTVSLDYSVAQYLSFFNDHTVDYDDETLALIRAIADYGHYAQPFLAANNNWTVGTEHAEMTAHYTDAYDLDSIKGEVAKYTFNKSIDGSGITKATYKLWLDSETTLDVYLTAAEGAEVTASADFNGKTYSAVKQSDGRYLVRVKGISAHQLGDTITITGTAGSSFTVTVSALSYARSVLNNDAFDANAKNAMAALYKYYDAVMKYRSNGN